MRELTFDRLRTLRRKLAGNPEAAELISHIEWLEMLLAGRKVRYCSCGNPVAPKCVRCSTCKVARRRAQNRNRTLKRKGQ